MARFVFGVPLILFLASIAFTQNQPQSNPQAVSFASRSIAALTGGQAIRDVTLTGNVTWSGGAAPETGTATLLGSGTGESRMSLLLPSGTRTEIRDASTGVAQGEWIAQSGKSGMFASENCATDAVWFFPALGSLAAGPNVVLTYVGQETRNGTAVQHIQSYTYQPNLSGVSPTPQQLSTTDFYLGATTLLPVTITFNAHPDNNAITNLPVEVDFSNYQVLNGILVPTHIERSLEGNVFVDITISSASFNTGLPLSDFTIN
ncbi:MAG: hypothetical protein ABSG23_03120 [Terriglobales bacterium]|jgi:hypothetical protein